MAISRALAGTWPLEGVTIGWDAGTPVVEDYRVPFRLNGIHYVDFELGGPKDANSLRY
jgi:hypothetical protein